MKVPSRIKLADPGITSGEERAAIETLRSGRLVKGSQCAASGSLLAKHLAFGDISPVVAIDQFGMQAPTSELNEIAVARWVDDRRSGRSGWSRAELVDDQWSKIDE